MRSTSACSVHSPTSSDWDARDADLIVGTSAGSVVGASLRVGLDPLDMRRRALGQPLSDAGAALIRRAETAVSEARVAAAEVAEDEPDAVAGLAARAARLRVASPERLMRAFREPWKVTPGSLFSAIVPAGRLPTGYIGAAYEDLHADGWPHRDLWIAAVDLDVGHRVVFGRDGSPEATLGQAVEASCAIPGYFAPVTIGDVRYVDGGAHSTTNADLVAEYEPTPDLVLVTVPMSAVGSAVLNPRTSIRQFARRSVAREAQDAARPGHRSRDVPADGRRPRGDVRRLDGPDEVRGRCAARSSSRRSPTFATPTSPTV